MDWKTYLPFSVHHVSGDLMGKTKFTEDAVSLLLLQGQKGFIKAGQRIVWNEVEEPVSAALLDNIQVADIIRERRGPMIIDKEKKEG